MIISYFIVEMFQQHQGEAYLIRICHANSQDFKLVLPQIPNHQPYCNLDTPASLFFDKTDHVHDDW